ncbi:MAG: hypothetical protein JJU11_18320 [Candidatus Sumerlaeia bacterium]|nr:hypothetical protein [Candidatus Sumerlaeia bacterium]
MNITRDELWKQFRNLDFDGLYLAWQQAAEPANPTDDFHRVVYSLGLFAAHQMEQGDNLMGSLADDGSIAPGDVAFVKALRADLLGEKEEIIRELWPHLDGKDAIHADKLRLRMADALLDLGRFDEIAAVLEPYLEPPGMDQTLESHLILLQGIVATGGGQERLVEQASLIDTLLERGFRMSHGSTVLFYADYLGVNGIEPLVAPLLKAHGSIVEQYVTPNPDEIELLLDLGERHKFPSAVRAAARSYERNPFPWNETDPEKAAYLFASHEEHNAARLTFLHSHDEESLDTDSEIWGPYLLETYLTGMWQETLDLLDKHSDDLASHPMAGQALVMRHSCLYHLGRFAESINFLDDNREEFNAKASPEEHAVDIFNHLALGRVDVLKTRTLATISALMPNGDLVDQYIQAILIEMMKRNDYGAFNEWIRCFFGAMGDGPRKVHLLVGVGHMAMEWGCEENMETCISLLREIGRDSDSLVMAAHKAAWFHHDSGVLEGNYGVVLEATASGVQPSLLVDRGRMRRLIGDLEGARKDLEKALEHPDAVPVHLASGILSSVYRSLGVERAVIEDVEKRALEWMKTKARSQEEFSSLQSRSLVAFRGDSPETHYNYLQGLQKTHPQSLEILRLARLLMTLPKVPEDMVRFAGELYKVSAERHLKPEWG